MTLAFETLSNFFFFLINFFFYLHWSIVHVGIPGLSAVKNLPVMQEPGAAILIPGWGRSSGGGHGNPLWYSCLENPMDRGVWMATVHGVAKSQTRLSDLACTHSSLIILCWFQVYSNGIHLYISGVKLRGLLMDTKFQLGKRKCPGDGWWWWLHSSVTVLNATKPYIYKWLKW